MAPLTRQLIFSQEFFERCCRLEKGVGLVYGVATDDHFHVFGLAICPNEPIKLAKAGLDRELSKCISHIQSSLPAGVGIIGHIFTKNVGFQVEDALESACATLSAEGMYGSLETPILIEVKEGGEVEAKLADDIIPHEVMPLAVILRSYVLVRLRGQFTVNVEGISEDITEEFATQIKRVTSGVYTFYLERSGAYLRSDEEFTGLAPDSLVKHLLETKKKRKTEEMEVLEAKLLAKPVKYKRLGEADPISDCAPVVQHRKRERVVSVVPVRVDSLSLVVREASLSDMYNAMMESLRRQLTAAESCVLSELHSTKLISPPLPFHFYPAPVGHLLTLLYPSAVPDLQLAGLRETRHDMLVIPKEQPFFRRGCKYTFPSDLPSNAPLFNPHEGLQPPSLHEGETSIVRGRYRYHHYMQDNFDDNGWGCAYRSLQTLVSWFQLQGYTNETVPTHRQIQQCLVNIGDKPDSFVGSRQWIGSTEVSFCLETLLQVQSRILSVSSGPELCSRADELLLHFNTHGTPVMIGGGVLAHTILGVCLDRENGDVRFLILDPHYTGSEDLATIQSKGWCAWKGPDFWVKNAFYNLCMPQRPQPCI